MGPTYLGSVGHAACMQQNSELTCQHQQRGRSVGSRSGSGFIRVTITNPLHSWTREPASPACKAAGEINSDKSEPRRSASSRPASRSQSCTSSSSRPNHANADTRSGVICRLVVSWMRGCSCVASSQDAQLGCERSLGSRLVHEGFHRHLPVSSRCKELEQRLFWLGNVIFYKKLQNSWELLTGASHCRTLMQPPSFCCSLCNIQVPLSTLYFYFSSFAFDDIWASFYVLTASSSCSSKPSTAAQFLALAVK